MILPCKGDKPWLRQIDDCVKAVEHLDFTQDELDSIEDILKE